MAGTNRNRKLLLTEAWVHYWHILFPHGTDAKTDIEAEIRACLCDPASRTEFVPLGRSVPCEPQWAANLKCEYTDATVTVSFRGKAIVTCPLFIGGSYASPGNWSDKNPFVFSGEMGGAGSREFLSIRDFGIAMVKRCGNMITGQLIKALKVKRGAEFEVYGRPGNDGFAGMKRVPASELLKVAGLDVHHNELQDRMGSRLVSDVYLKKTKPTGSTAGPKGSFSKKDDQIVEKMRAMIDTGEAASARAAAKALCHKARSRKKSSDESVIRRLQARYSEKYPNDSNRRAEVAR